MSQIEGVFELPVHNWWFREDYNWVEGAYKQPGDDKAIATIREYLDGDIADVRLTTQTANTVTSIVQTFVDAAAKIQHKLVQMEGLTEKSVYGHYTGTDKASMQKEMEALAADINSIVNNTACVDNTEGGKNKLLSAEGETIEKRIDEIRTIKLFPKDLSFDIAGVDLTSDPQAALATVKKAVKQAKEYTNYLNNQNKFLQNEMSIIESRPAGADGITAGIFETKTAQQIINGLSAAILQDPHKSTQTQSNVTPDEALYLLKES